MYGEVTAFIKPNYIISKKTAKLSGTQALLGVWGEAMLLAAAEQLCVRIALAQLPLIRAALPRARCLALAPTLSWAGFKGGSLGNVSPQVTLSIVSGLGIYMYVYIIFLSIFPASLRKRWLL